MNSRLDEMQAAILATVMLPQLERWTARRIAGGEVSIPIHPYLAENDVVRVAAVVSAWEG